MSSAPEHFAPLAPVSAERTAAGRRRRSDAGALRCTDRDLELLGLVGEQYALSLPQLARLMDRSLHAARWLRARWQRAGWATGRAVLVGQPVFVWLTRRGQRVAYSEYSLWRPNPGALAHIAAVTEVRLWVAARHPEAEWVCERELAREARIAGTAGQHRPDGLVVLEGRELPVEVELSHKRPARRERIMRELVTRYGQAAYFAPDGPRQLLEQSAEVAGSGRVQIFELPQPNRSLAVNQAHDNDGWIGALLVGAVGAIISLPAMVLVLPLIPVARWRRAAMFVAALIGLGVTALLWSRITGQMEAALAAMRRAGGFWTDPERALTAAWPHVWTWWLMALGLAPAAAFTIDLFRPRSVEELRDREERRTDRVRARRERKARKAAGAPAPERRPVAFELGRHIDGDRLLPIRRGRVQMPLGRLEKTVLVIGAPGSGKTETLLRLARGVATSSDWCVFVLDAKGDPHTQQRFADVMRQAGRQPHLFPGEGYAGWRGSGREIANRLVQLVDWADEGGGTYYRDLSVNLVRAACQAPQGPPRSSGELLHRLDRGRLTDLWAGDARAETISSFKGEYVDACRQRYAAFFDATEGQLDGRWAFEDTDSGYLLLNELLYGEETSKLGRFLVEEFKQYVAARKQHGQRVLLIIDEFSAIADGERVARMIETVRSYGAAVVLAPQAFEGMGGPEASARILNAAHTVLLHAVPDPEPIVKAAGTRLAIEQSLQHEAGLSTDIGSSRQQHQLKADPNEVRRLQNGMCYALGSGKAQKLQVAAVPNASRHQHRADDLWTTSAEEGLADDPRDDDEPLRL